MFNAPREEVSEVDELSNLSELPNSAWYTGVTPRFFFQLEAMAFFFKATITQKSEIQLHGTAIHLGILIHNLCRKNFNFQL